MCMLLCIHTNQTKQIMYQIPSDLSGSLKLDCDVMYGSGSFDKELEASDVTWVKFTPQPSKKWRYKFNSELTVFEVKEDRNCHNPALANRVRYFVRDKQCGKYIWLGGDVVIPIKMTEIPESSLCNVFDWINESLNKVYKDKDFFKSKYYDSFPYSGRRNGRWHHIIEDEMHTRPTISGMQASGRMFRPDYYPIHRKPDNFLSDKDLIKSVYDKFFSKETNDKIVHITDGENSDSTDNAENND